MQLSYTWERQWKHPPATPHTGHAAQLYLGKAVETPSSYTSHRPCSSAILGKGSGNTLQLHLTQAMQPSCTWERQWRHPPATPRTGHAAQLYLGKAVETPSSYTSHRPCSSAILGKGSGDTLQLHLTQAMQLSYTWERQWKHPPATPRTGHAAQLYLGKAVEAPSSYTSHRPCSSAILGKGSGDTLQLHLAQTMQLSYTWERQWKHPPATPRTGHAAQLYLGKAVESKDLTYRVEVGKQNLKEVEAGSKAIAADKLFVHEKWNPIFVAFGNDVALVKLAEHVTLSDSIRLACIPEPEAILPNNQPCYITGWGRLYTNGPIL
ncbi:UNVERIFIED_CONTAM: hypothetical protein FKN15_004882 [Acipenser sinensis]